VARNDRRLAKGKAPPDARFQISRRPEPASPGSDGAGPDAPAREEQEPDRHRDHCGNHNGDSHRVEGSDGPCGPAIARQLVCLRLRTASVSISR
jgi:hypothetical protein